MPLDPTSGSGKSQPGRSGQATTVHGTVQAGVEAGCLVMDTADGMLNLLGATTQLRPGMRVEIRGAPDDDRMSFCQQGRPFVVTGVRILG